MSKPYITCPNCGSNLDPGERCECKREHEANSDNETAQSAGKLTVKTEAANQPEPALAFGA